MVTLMTDKLNESVERLNTSLEEVSQGMDKIFMDMNSVFVAMDDIFDQLSRDYSCEALEKGITLGNTTYTEKKVSRWFW